MIFEFFSKETCVSPDSLERFNVVEMVLCVSWPSKRATARHTESMGMAVASLVAICDSQGIAGCNKSPTTEHGCWWHIQLLAFFVVILLTGFLPRISGDLVQVNGDGQTMSD